MFVALLSALVVLVEASMGSVANVRGQFAQIFTPVHALARLPVDLVDRLGASHRDMGQLQADLERLKVQNNMLLVRQQRMQAAEAENEELRRLLGASRRIDDQFVHAEVLAYSHDPFVQRLTVNRGFGARAATGQAVVDQFGLVGQIVEVGSLSSQVLLVTDSSHQVPVTVARTGLKAVARGTGDADRLELLNVPVTAAIKAGDMLVTSGLGQRFPAGYPVARVLQVNRVPGRAFSEIVAAPVARTDRANSVMLVYRAQSARDRALASLEGDPGDS
ncbi:rod shape-determining protein MreC [Litorivicinus lipolyticus]|uniref:rod shape-determining protein MreC n=1 Tax=Litorivicinus lipolyticus TaxID=418701 RepID=UPI003B59982A